MSQCGPSSGSEERQAKERKENEEKRLTTRKRVAALYAGYIEAWLQRKDIEDVMADLHDIQDKDALQRDFKFLVGERVKTIANSKVTSEGLWDPQIQYVAAKLRLFAFERMSAIPNIWHAQFRRDDVDFLDGTDPAYFTAMDTIWTNLNLKAQQLVGSVNSLKPFKKEEADLMPLLVNAIAQDAVELREHIAQFLNAAKEGALGLRNYPLNGQPELHETATASFTTKTWKTDSMFRHSARRDRF